MDIFCTVETFVRLLTPCLCYFVMLLFKEDTYRSDNNDREYTELKIYGILMIYSGVLDIAYFAMDIRDVNTLPGGYSTAVAICVRILRSVCTDDPGKILDGRQAQCCAKGTGKTAWNNFSCFQITKQPKFHIPGIRRSTTYPGLFYKHKFCVTSQLTSQNLTVNRDGLM